MGINVIALGGNAILDKLPTDDAQKAVVRSVAKDIVEFMKTGEKVVICHGNGPQVGNILVQQKLGETDRTPMMKLDTNVAMTEGSIGYWIQQALLNEMRAQGINKQAITVVTQVEVDKNDPSFENPTKPVGPFYSYQEAQDEMKGGEVFVEDSGRGYRRVVPSPKLKKIIEADVIESLLENNFVPICVGGGGIPVCQNDNGEFVGVEAVIDKDFSASKLAKELNADRLIIVTGVDNIYINYNQPDQAKLETISVDEAKGYIQQGQFPAGSMLPKVLAGIEFVIANPLKETVITSIEKLKEIHQGAGTKIQYQK